MSADSQTRKLERKQKAAAKVHKKEMRLSDKNKPTKKAQSKQADAVVTHLEAQQNPDRAQATKTRSVKLERQLASLIQKDAQLKTIQMKADEMTKAKYREARVADFGRRDGFKASAPRVARRTQALVAAC